LNNAAIEATGYSDEELRGKDATSLVHPDDLDWVLQSMLQISTDPSRAAATIVRILRKDGSIIPTDLKVGALTNPVDGVAYLVSFRDATSTIAVEEFVASAVHNEPIDVSLSALLRSARAHETMPVSFHWIENRIDESSGFSMTLVSDPHLHDWVTKGPVNAWVRERAFAGGGQVADTPYAAARSCFVKPIEVDGHLIAAFVLWSPHDHFGTAGVQFVNRIGELATLAFTRRAAERKLQRRATTDSLTGSVNRSEFLESLIAHLAIGSTSSLLMFDLNTFKRVNDDYGHHIGDEVLIESASRIREMAGHNGVVGRIGGDEFAAIIEIGDEVAVQEFIERLEARLHEPISTSCGEIQVGASVGSARIDSARTASDLMADADASMYLRKRQQREQRELQQRELQPRAQLRAQLNLKQLSN
jgi:diguanylate cyclase (GGDEF)-like protein/PAS domain S-box-containing protein